MNDNFEDFLKILTTYKMKQVTRSTSNEYYCDKENKDIKRKETNAEHIYSSLRLADYFLSNEEEFKELDRLRVFELLLYHDDVEIETGDTPLHEEEQRKNKEEIEKEAIPPLAKKYPQKTGEKLLERDREFRKNKTPEAQFAHAIDKLDAMIHELQYKKDWERYGFTEEKSRSRYGPPFTYSKTLTTYFETLIQHLQKEGYFEFENTNP